MATRFHMFNFLAHLLLWEIFHLIRIGEDYIL